MRNLEENIRQLIPSEVALDALLVCADKPTNYTGVRNSLFTYQDLWMVVKSFAAARSHPPQAIAEAILSIQGATSEAGEKLPDMMSYEGVEPKSGTPGAALYNARVEHFQDLIYNQSKDRIEQSVLDTLGTPVERARERECQIARVYLQYLNDILFHNQSAAGISIDIDKFRHHYNSIYGAEMPATITEKLIILVLQMSRLGYEYDNRFYPFWYTVRGDAGRKFRQMLSDSIAARIS